MHMEALMESTSLTVQSIPLSKIRPNPNNPRRVIHNEAVEALAASFKAVGQETPIKVRPLTPEERTADPGIEYELVGGHLRLEAAKKLGWESLNALVLDLSPDQAELAAILDNQGEDMHWLDWYIAIERRWKAHPGPSQRKIADELGVSPMTINRALKVTGFLSPSAREAIVTDCYKNPDADPISEGAVRALADLG